MQVMAKGNEAEPDLIRGLDDVRKLVEMGAKRVSLKDLIGAGVSGETLAMIKQLCREYEDVGWGVALVRAPTGDVAVTPGREGWFGKDNADMQVNVVPTKKGIFPWQN